MLILRLIFGTLGPMKGSSLLPIHGYRFWRDLASGEPIPIPSVGEVMEAKLRKRVFRLGRPGFIKRMQYRLNRDRTLDPEAPPPDPPYCDCMRSSIPAAGGRTAMPRSRTEVRKGGVVGPNGVRPRQPWRPRLV